MRLVLDTSVLVAAFRSCNGASHQLVQALDSGSFDLLLSQPLFLEYEAVLKRTEQRKAHGLSLQGIDDFLNGLVPCAIQVPFSYRLRPQLRDPDDEMVLETAVNGVADAIVTHNLADFYSGALRFGIPVLRPGDIMRMRLNR